MILFGRLNAVLCVAVFAFGVWAGIACAAKNVTVRFTQSAEDCATVARWEVYTAVIGTGDPAATDASLAGLVTAPSGVCGVETLEEVVSIGVPGGNTRFWLRTVVADGARSAFSNPQDAVVPPNAPVIVEILFQ